MLRYKAIFSSLCPEVGSGLLKALTLVREWDCSAMPVSPSQTDECSSMGNLGTRTKYVSSSPLLHFVSHTLSKSYKHTFSPIHTMHFPPVPHSLSPHFLSFTRPLSLSHLNSLFFFPIATSSLSRCLFHTHSYSPSVPCSQISTYISYLCFTFAIPFPALLFPPVAISVCITSLFSESPPTPQANGS